MPLLEDGSQVSPLPLPSKLTSLSPDTEVWSIHQTGEIFLDYESYANRYIFYSQPIFKPNHHQQESTDLLTFFDALQSEDYQLDSLIRSEFSDSLKSRILACITTPDAQCEHSIDDLTDHLYKLHYNRFHKDEKVIVDLSFNQPSSPSSTIYTARIVKVFPPKPLRDLVKSNQIQSSDLIHLQSINQFNWNLNETLKIDDSKSYLYTIQLIEDSHHHHHHHHQEDGFGDSFMEVEPKKLSRHPNSFSKSLLKKFIQSSVLPVSRTQPNQRWRVPDELMKKYGLIDTQPPLSIPNLPSRVSRGRPKRGAPSSLHTSLLIDTPEIADPESKRTIKKRKRNQIPTTPLQLHPLPTYESYTEPQCSMNPTKPKEDSTRGLHSIDLIEWKPTESFSKIISKPSPPLETPDHQKKLKWRMSSNNHQIKEKLKLIPNSIEKEKPKKLLLEQQTMNSNLELSLSTPVVTENGEQLSRTNSVKKPIKYPIEDLDLDPLTMIDGRYLRRSSGFIPSLPIKPIPSKPKDPKTFEKRLKIWSFLNIFELIECKLEEIKDDRLDLIIERLVIEIQNDELILRYPTSKIGKSNQNRFNSKSNLPKLSNLPIEESKLMNFETREYWIRQSIKFSNLWRSKINKLTQSIQSGIQDQKKKKKSSKEISLLNELNELKDDWVMGLIEIMCQRGGIEQIGCMGRLMKYLFSKDGSLILLSDYQELNPIQSKDTNQSSTDSHDLPINGFEVGNETEVEVEEEEEIEEITNEEEIQKYGESFINQQSKNDDEFIKRKLKSRFNELNQSSNESSNEEKLNLIQFLCDLLIEGNYIRNYIETCDEKLTIVRKEKADVKKEKRKILEELSKLGNGNKSLNENTPSKSISGEESYSITNQSSTVTTPILPSPIQPQNPRNETSENETSLTIPIGSELETPVRYKTLLFSKSIKPPSITKPKDLKGKLELELYKLNLKELLLNESFRKFNGVIKTKMIGIDRNFCKYWWFDLIGNLKNCIGQLFVSGPTKDEMDWVLNKIEGSSSSSSTSDHQFTLGVGEWAIYDTEVQIQGLLNWLNPKGNRESILRMNLKDWKEYLIEKIQNRSSLNEFNHHQKDETNEKNLKNHQVRIDIEETDSSLSSQEDEPNEPNEPEEPEEEEEIEYNNNNSDSSSSDSSSSSSSSSDTTSSDD